MTVYLVDFENVRSGGLRGVEELSEGDKVVIFYSKNADAITFDVHMLLSKSKAEIETFRILRGGRNSLDFQLSTYLGYLVMENCYKNIVIISQDKGFLCATSFWEENQELCNCNIRLCKSIATSDVESSTSDEFDDGLTGKFIEKIDMRKSPFMQNSNSNDNDDNDSSTETEHQGLVKQPSNNRNSAEGETQSYERHSDRGYDKGYGRRYPEAKQAIKDNQSVPGRFVEYKTGDYRSYGNYQNNSYSLNRPKFAGNSNSSYNTNRPRYNGNQNNSYGTNRPRYNSNYNNSYGINRPRYNGNSNGSYNLNTEVKTEEVKAEKVKTEVNNTTEKKPNLNIQNPTSKNKIFAAEVKLNITDDIKNIIGDKYEEDVVPVLVETIGKSTGKQHFYRMLVSRLGQEKGHELYMMIKGQYANLKRK
ncbi:MAG: PIN domain-containing protein [Clostridiales bacterium]|nr:PIN domain-containing protein [Clostridiales bacterium]MDD6292424.1 PIN domain-containing protein [Eubacteriales bacterium]